MRQVLTTLAMCARLVSVSVYSADLCMTASMRMCSQEKMMQRVGAELVAIQASTRMRPPDPDAAPPVVVHAALGSEAAAKDLLLKLGSMQAQVSPVTTCSTSLLKKAA